MWSYKHLKAGMLFICSNSQLGLVAPLILASVKRRGGKKAKLAQETRKLHPCLFLKSHGVSEQHENKRNPRFLLDINAFSFKASSDSPIIILTSPSRLTNRVSHTDIPTHGNSSIPSAAARTLTLSTHAHGHERRKRVRE